jgi:5-methylcytosine-specific restriction endonuclease McrA
MYKCPRCDYKTDIKGNLGIHFEKKNVCKAIYADIDVKKYKKEILEGNKICSECNIVVTGDITEHFTTCINNIKSKHNKLKEDMQLLESKYTILVKDSSEKDHKINDLTKQIDVLKAHLNEVTEEKEKESEIHVEEKEVAPKLDNKRKKINVVIRQAVWYKNIGKNIGCIKCPCCNINEITQMNFVAGHVVSIKNGGENSVDNLLPICSICNSSMGPMNMDKFIKMNNKIKGT